MERRKRMTIQEALVKRREELGLSVSEMAAKAGLSYNYYWQIENRYGGKYKLTRYKTVVAIAKVLGVTPEEVEEMSDEDN
jgi:transcriptional regulator with XRE-family HTH domain